MSVVASFPKQGAVLWAVDVELEKDVFRSGAATKANVDYLRFVDLGMGEEGRIPAERAGILTIAPGKGISLFLERMIPEGMVVLDAKDAETVSKKLQKKVHWWGIDQKQSIPDGLVLIYDGQPPGHCTLTVTREMTITGFLQLVALVTFSLKGIDLCIPK